MEPAETSDVSNPEPRKTAIVTGAGSGIGRAAAHALQAAGYNVVITGRRSDKLEKTAAGASADGGRILAVAADVTDPLAVKKVFKTALSEFGRVDVVFNNAGIGARPVSIDELEIDEWRAVVDTNLSGMFYCCREAVAVMKKQVPKGGRIINNGSISAHTPRPFSAPYTATKHAVTGLTKSIALDGRADNIACSQIDIGNAATEMTAAMAAGILQPDGTTRVEARMDVEQVAGAVVYIANLPLDTNVLFMTIKATTMPFEGRG
ncbi:MAG: SDR family oxidoreductase [Pseudomonadota bacterium]